MHALVIDGLVHQVFDLHSPNIVECPEDTRRHATYDADTKTFTNPIAHPKRMDPVFRCEEFKRKFTLDERIKIHEAREYPDSSAIGFKLKDALNVLFDDLDDPKKIYINVRDSLVIEVIDLCVLGGVLSAERANVILQVDAH